MSVWWRRVFLIEHNEGKKEEAPRSSVSPFLWAKAFLPFLDLAQGTRLSHCANYGDERSIDV